MGDAVLIRRTVYSLLLTAAVAIVAVRIFTSGRIYEPYLFKPKDASAEDQRGAWPAERPRPMPTHGSNDRSRWATMRALVEDGTYVIGHRDVDSDDPKKFTDRGIIIEDGWFTVDKVLNPETHDFYSSKPPLLPTLLAGEYWLLHRAFGWTFETNPWGIVWTVLLTVNALPLLLYLWCFARLADRFGTTDWGRFFAVTAACFGTFVTAFDNTLNNHTIAASCVVFSLYPAVLIAQDGRREPWLFLLSGFFAGFAACNELPSLAFSGLVFLWLLAKAPRQTLLLFVPAAAVPVAAFFYTNYLALGSWRPAYSEFGGPWYEFEGSHWKPDSTKPKRGIDWAKLYEGRGEYAFNFLVGHHGVFSLTPVFLLAIPGMLWGVYRLVTRQRNADNSLAVSRPPGTTLAVGTLILTLVVVGFYLYKSDNYGGWTIGPRWLLWLSPLWLLALLPIADWLSASRGGRLLAYLLLAVSVFSASFSSWNPWRQPWLYNLLESQGLIPY